MNAFLFIPVTHESRLPRRVDFANIATLFADAEEPAPRVAPFKRQALRLAAMLMILLAMVGDMILVAKPKLLAAAMTGTHEATIEIARANV